MSCPHLKAVVFDIGGVVARSPLIAIQQYEREHKLPHNYVNCSITGRGPSGAFQKFERGEIDIFSFYELFGRELSDTENGNRWFADYCHQKGIPCPKLPTELNIDGRELFGRMMRESAILDEIIVEAIHRIRAVGKWRIIALTNNFSKLDERKPPVAEETGATAGSAGQMIDRYTNLDDKERIANELDFLGWKNGVTPPGLRALFDDFCDSSTTGMRKPDPNFYLLACSQNGVRPDQCVFLDDLGMNLKAAQKLGMETIHVPIGGSLGALRQLEEKLGIDLTSTAPRTSQNRL